MPSARWRRTAPGPRCHVGSLPPHGFAQRSVPSTPACVQICTNFSSNCGPSSSPRSPRGSATRRLGDSATRRPDERRRNCHRAGGADGAVGCTVARRGRHDHRSTFCGGPARADLWQRRHGRNGVPDRALRLAARSGHVSRSSRICSSGRPPIHPWIKEPSPRTRIHVG